MRRSPAGEPSPLKTGEGVLRRAEGLPDRPPGATPPPGAQRAPRVPSWKPLLGVPDEAGAGRKAAEDRPRHRRPCR